MAGMIGSRLVPTVCSRFSSSNKSKALTSVKTRMYEGTVSSIIEVYDGACAVSQNANQVKSRYPIAGKDVTLHLTLSSG